jgi:hypothetical protein
MAHAIAMDVFVYQTEALSKKIVNIESGIMRKAYRMIK